MASTRIGVVIRVRPFLEHEKRMNFKMTRMTTLAKENEIRILSEDAKTAKVFKFDRIFEPETTQEVLYNEMQIENLINKVVEGFHATIFAYGQTGSGKTFTMEGYKYETKTEQEKVPRPLINLSSKDVGLIPRTVTALFEMIKAHKKLFSRTYTVYCSFLQIYNEKIFDLLNPVQMSKVSQASAGLRLRWKQKDEFTVENLFIFECKTAEEVIEHFHSGIKNRMVASHKLNLASSRSHTILSLRVESVDLQKADNILVSKLDLVDLAGSEKTSLTGNESAVAQKESIEINKSLFTLRQVISNLSEVQKPSSDKKKRTHIPYRESKLTCLLKQSIGGNCYCLMIACLSPADSYFEENISTLTYATKAAFISNDPTRNDDPKTTQINDLKSKVVNLAFELNKANEHITFLSHVTNEKIKHHGIEILESQQGSLQSDAGGDKMLMPRNAERNSRNKSFSGDVIELETPTNIRQISDKMQQPIHISNDQISTRLIETVNMVRDLLKSNREVRELLDKSNKKNEQLENETFQLQVENQELRDKMQIYESMIQTGATSTEENKDWAKFLTEEENVNVISQYKSEVANEIITLRRDKKILENRVQNLEIENINLSQRVYPGFSTREPKRGLIDVNPQLYQYSQAIKLKTKFLHDESRSQQIYSDLMPKTAVGDSLDPSLFGLSSANVKMPPIIDSAKQYKHSSLVFEDTQQQQPQSQQQPNRRDESMLNISTSKPNSTLLQFKQSSPYVTNTPMPRPPHYNKNATPLRTRNSGQSNMSYHINSITRNNSRGSQANSDKFNLSFT